MDDSGDTSGTELALSVVVPFYNPGTSLKATVSAIVQALREAQLPFEILAVNDGSTDGSAQSLAGLAPEVRVLGGDVNRGKGAALHLGFAQARGHHVAMIDADGDIDPHHLVTYYAQAVEGNYPAVVASREVEGSSSRATGVRKLMSVAFNTLVSVLFSLKTRDTQVGCKVFRRDDLASVLPLLREHRFAFDLEFFVLARKFDIAPIKEAPVVIGHRQAGSTVGMSATLQTIYDAFAIFGRLHFTSAYRKLPAKPAPPVSAAQAVPAAQAGPAGGKSGIDSPAQAEALIVLPAAITEQHSGRTP